MHNIVRNEHRETSSPGLLSPRRPYVRNAIQLPRVPGIYWHAAAMLAALPSIVSILGLLLSAVYKAF